MLDSKPSLDSLLAKCHDALESEQNAMRRVEELETSEPADRRPDDALFTAEHELAHARDERLRLDELYWEERRLSELPGYT